MGYKLTGDDAIRFSNSLFNPTDEDICRHNALIDRINNDVKITEAQDGFKAEIKNLNLFKEKKF